MVVIIVIIVLVVSNTVSRGGGFDVGTVGLYVAGCGGSSHGIKSDSVVGHFDL